MIPLIAALLLSVACSAQIPTVSFSPQGAEILRQSTGKTIKGFQLIGTMVCSPQAMTFSGGQVYSAAGSAGIAWQGPEATGLTLTRTSGMSWQARAVTIGQFGSITALSLMSAGVISVAPKWLSAVTLAHQGSDTLFGILKFQAPSPATLLGLIVMPQATYNVSAGGCIEGIIGAKFPGPGAVLVPLPGVR